MSCKRGGGADETGDTGNGGGRTEKMEYMGAEGTGSTSKDLERMISVSSFDE